MGCGMSTASAPSAPSTDQNPLANQKFIDRKQFLQHRNQQIEQSLTRPSTSPLKLLLLGAGESGKSTVVKQMRLIHGSGFSDRERVQYTGVIWSDAVQSMRILVSSAQQLGIPLDSDRPGPLHEYNRLVMATDPVQQYKEDMPNVGETREMGSTVGSNGVPIPSRSFLDDYVLKYDRRRYDKYGRLKAQDDLIVTCKVDTGREEEEEELLKDMEGEDKREVEYKSDEGTLPSKMQVATAISELWKRDKGIQECFRRANEFQLEVNAAYYFEKIFDYAKPGYRATDADILKGRIKTTGINETVINIQNWTFRVIDVGGQRSERRKWIHCFEDVTAIVFVAAVSEYDEVLFEDATMNRMAEALLLFESICNSRWFSSTLIILFLNKVDKLEQKLQQSPITRYFRDYVGDPRDVGDAIAYFKSLFLALNKNPRRAIYVHRTCATDTGVMKVVILAVTNLVIERSLIDSGMV